jgi:hypothetical protein
MKKVSLIIFVVLISNYNAPNNPAPNAKCNFNPMNKLMEMLNKNKALLKEKEGNDTIELKK